MGGVTLTAEATERSVGIVGAVASGAGESLNLPLEPATRLNAIAIEAASNVVAHAYPGSSGPLELEISSPDRGPLEDLRVVVRDSGSGLLTAVSPAESDGLGLSLICALADEVEIKSGALGGVSLAATIKPSGTMETPAVTPPDTDPRIGGALTFAGMSFVEAVLPRTLAALVAGSTTAIDVLTSVLRRGDAIAYGLRACQGSGTTSTVAWDGDSPREIRLGPLVGNVCREMVEAVAAVEPLSRSWLGIEPAGLPGQDFARVDLPHF